MSLEDNADLISRYTRAEALADGDLVDVSQHARELGFRVPVALSRAVHGQYVQVPEGVRCQDEAGRLHDILWMLRVALGRACDQRGPELLFIVCVRNTNQPGDPPEVTLKAHFGAGDQGEPVVTILLPEED